MLETKGMDFRINSVFFFSLQLQSLPGISYKNLGKVPQSWSCRHLQAAQLVTRLHLTYIIHLILTTLANEILF